MAPSAKTGAAPSKKPTRSISSTTRLYLKAYNGVSFLGWLVVFGRVVLMSALAGPDHVYNTVGDFAKYLQSLAILEIVHAAVGIVPSPVFTTGVQVLSRLTLVWGIVDSFPANTKTSPAYASMLFAWSFTEIIRYSYYYSSLGTVLSSSSPSATSYSAKAEPPALLTWLRYNTFLILYPLGVGSEMTLVYKAIPEAQAKHGQDIKWAFYAILATYAPGFYMLYGYMLKQRAKVSRGKTVKRS